jgi:hypothetical protein
MLLQVALQQYLLGRTHKEFHCLDQQQEGDSLGNREDKSNLFVSQLHLLLEQEHSPDNHNQEDNMFILKNKSI